MTQLRLTLFGPPRLERDGKPVAVSRRKALALLAYLATTRQAHSRDTLATLFWPETSQRKARGNLRRALSDLSREIGKNRLILDGETVALTDDEGLWCDIVRFRSHLAACADHGHPADDSCGECLPPLAAAADLYQADFLAGFTLRDAHDFDDWQYFEGEGLRRALALALERLVRGHSAQGDCEAAIPYTRRWLALDPLHEPAQQTLMQLYHQAGQTSAALRQYELFVTLMDKELGQPPADETTHLYDAIKANRLGTPGPRAPDLRQVVRETGPPMADRPRHHLPAQVTSFVGREKELGEIGGFLANRACRLITLVGPGGIGKTRLSLAAAKAAKDGFADGVHFVSLAPLHDAGNIISVVIESLDIHFYGQAEPRTQLLDYLSSKELLLVMDNFEHLLAGVNSGANEVAGILSAAPQVKILTTSRERLNLSGETVFVVGGMTYPGLMEGRGSAHRFAEYSGVKLLLQQARLVRPGLELDKDDLNEVARICRLVQGMPLAIVLAASWLEMLSLAQIADEIARSLDFLETEMRDVPDRQRSMRAVFDTSWEHLSADEQAIFMKLSVFRGGFAREAGEVVASATLRALRGLVNKSFVLFNQAGRFEVHELLRQYGREMLVASGLEDATRQRHSEYYLDFVEQREADLRGRAQADGLRMIEADFDNIRAAWDWALGRENKVTVSNAAEAVHLYFDMNGLYRAGIKFLDRGVNIFTPSGDEPPGRAWAKLVARLRFMQSLTGNVAAEWENDLNICLLIAEQAQDKREAAFCTAVLGAYSFAVKEDPPAGLTLFEQALHQFDAVGDDFYQARVFGWMALCHRVMENPIENEFYFRKKLELTRRNGDMAGVNVALYNLTEVALISGRYAEVETNCEEMIRTGSGLTQPFSHCLLSLGHLFRGELDEVEQGLQKARALYSTSHTMELLGLMTAVSSVRAALGGDNEVSEREARECLATSVNDPLYITLANWGLAMSSCNQGRFPATRRYLTEAFRPARNLASAAMQCWLLPVAAVISAGEGQPDRALELLTLATNHPLCPTGWHACWPPLTKLQAKLAAKFAPDVTSHIWTHGQTLTVETVVAHWLEAGDLPQKIGRI